MKKLKVTIVLLLIFQAVLAQKITPEQVAARKVAELDNKVNLSESQKTEVAAIFKETATQMQTLKKAETDNNDAIKALRKETKESVRALLTNEQQQILKEEHKEERGQNKAARDKIKEYHNKNVRPVIFEKRKSFDSKLTDEEKEVINQARALKPDFEKGHKVRERSSEEKHNNNATREEIKMLLTPIVNAHRSELEIIAEELQPTFEAEKEFIELNKSNNDESHPKKGQFRGKEHSPEQFMFRFLLVQ